MKITIDQELVPLRVPNYVLIKQNGGLVQGGGGAVDTPKCQLSDLSEEVLHQMCNKFKEDVFKKAGKKLVTNKLVK